MQLELGRLLSAPLSDACHVVEANSDRLAEVTFPMLASCDDGCAG